MSLVTLSSSSLQAKYGPRLEAHLFNIMTTEDLCSEMGPCLRLFKIVGNGPKAWAFFSKEELLRAFPPSLDNVVALFTLHLFDEYRSLIGDEALASLCVPTYDTLRSLRGTQGLLSSFFHVIPLPSTREEVSLLVASRLELLLMKVHPLHEIQRVLDAIGDVTSSEEIQALYRKDRRETSLRFYYGEPEKRSPCHSPCWTCAVCTPTSTFDPSSQSLVDFLPYDTLGEWHYYDYRTPKNYRKMTILPLLTQCWRIARAF